MAMVFEDVIVSYRARMVINGQSGVEEIRQYDSSDTYIKKDWSKVNVCCMRCRTKADVEISNEVDFYRWYRNP